ncbi:hypothetical protein Psyr_2847 [Pseudomonas syringae pv. syringae B728a]|uniref:Uncharacterized protein n=1 Tax=Pseudomonas syringae pv. syringae (strain B728a) TaxID=205918 RepID=Q4ZSI7_PSEU2|nr:hypothetical protein Psyr_2847 [Pseudomonas syringae pv. syringae B728a]PYD18441.1 hypothetical protein DND47_04690 [Pseudomonas syringae pv. syringae]
MLRVHRRCGGNHPVRDGALKSPGNLRLFRVRRMETQRGTIDLSKTVITSRMGLYLAAGVPQDSTVKDQISGCPRLSALFGACHARAPHQLCMSMSFVTFAISVDLVAQQSVFFRHQVSVLFKHLLLRGAERPVFGVVDVHDGGSSNSV